MEKKKINKKLTLEQVIISQLPKLKPKYEWHVYEWEARSFSGNIVMLNISLFEIRQKQTPLLKEWLITSIFEELPKLEDIPKGVLLHE